LTAPACRIYFAAVRIPYFQVNAFTKTAFGGNPAGVCVLEQWLEHALLQRIAAENNLSETAFFTREGNSYRLRWFTPTVEVDLCGHATLATAAALFFELGVDADRIEFQTKSGLLTATVVGRGSYRTFGDAKVVPAKGSAGASPYHHQIIELDFPSVPPAHCQPLKPLARALGREPLEVLASSRDFVAVFESQDDVVALSPDMDALCELDREGVIVTARGSDADFVSRFFAPKLGVPEDPVTGSAHCSLIPFWAQRLARNEMFARQISKRGGELFCRLAGDRVAIGGHAVIYKRGELEV
jgi:predicted PhzF superfamily epimerase YddE/YHI9